MKHRRPKIYKPWTKEETLSQVENIKNQIKDLNREIADINSTITYWLEEKKIMQAKISNKHIYLNQLNAQLQEAE